MVICLHIMTVVISVIPNSKWRKTGRIKQRGGADGADPGLRSRSWALSLFFSFSLAIGERERNKLHLDARMAPIDREHVCLYFLLFSYYIIHLLRSITLCHDDWSHSDSLALTHTRTFTTLLPMRPPLGATVLFILQVFIRIIIECREWITHGVLYLCLFAILP